VSRNLIASRAGVLAAAATAGVLATAGPALADATVAPAGAPQGGSVNLHFTVTNTGQSAMTRVKLLLPADTPIAEVFPLSVDNWAPQITTMKLATPLTTIHGGAPVTETASAITWLSVRGKAIPPGGSAELAVALGPMPYTSQMRFTLQPTYADGKAGPAIAPVTLPLAPAAAGPEATGHSGHGGTTGNTAADDAAFAAVVAEAQGPGFWSIAGWVVAALAVAAALVMMLRGRRGTAPADTGEEPDGSTAQAKEPDGPTAEAAEPVTTGAKVSNWRYQDGP
jgi:hypothetical protein